MWSYLESNVKAKVFRSHRRVGYQCLWSIRILSSSKSHPFYMMKISDTNSFVLTQVPLGNQNRVLTYGIIGAVVMRAIFIALGEAAMNLFQPVLLGFAAILIFSSYKLLTEGEGDEDEDLSDNKLIAFASSILDATDFYDGDLFFTLVTRSNSSVCAVDAFQTQRYCYNLSNC